MLKDKKIGFIGVGNMGSAFLSGLISMGIPKENIYASDKHKGDILKEEYDIDVFNNNFDLAEHSEIIIIAVKPVDIFDCLSDIKEAVDDKKLIISMAAGIKTTDIAGFLRQDAKIARIMPNIAALVRESVTAIYCNDYITKEEEEIVIAITSLIGRTVVLETEELMDAITGLSGSGPAYAFEIIEAMADGGVKMGLKRKDAIKLSAQVLKGAAELVLKLKMHPAELKDLVTSPGGSTIYGLNVMERAGLRGILMDTIEAATNRSKELGKSKNQY